jgi:hypothetical protein
MFPVWWHWKGRYTQKGLVKLALGRILKLLTLLSSIYALAFAVRNGGAKSEEALKGIVAKLRLTLKTGMQRIAGVL